MLIFHGKLGRGKFSPEFPEGIHKKVWKKGKRRVITVGVLIRPSGCCQRVVFQRLELMLVLIALTFSAKALSDFIFFSTC